MTAIRDALLGRAWIPPRPGLIRRLPPAITYAHQRSHNAITQHRNASDVNAYLGTGSGEVVQHASVLLSYSSSRARPLFAWLVSRGLKGRRKQVLDDAK